MAVRTDWLQVRVAPVKRAKWREAAGELGVTLTALVERAVDECVAAELAARSEAGRLAADRERLRGRVFPAKPQERR